MRPRVDLAAVKSSFQGFEVAGVGKTDARVAYRRRRGGAVVSGWMRRTGEMEAEWRDGVMETCSDAPDKGVRERR